jgi:hypothetical protein
MLCRMHLRMVLHKQASLQDADSTSAPPLSTEGLGRIRQQACALHARAVVLQARRCSCCAVAGGPWG